MPSIGNPNGEPCNARKRFASETRRRTSSQSFLSPDDAFASHRHVVPRGILPLPGGAERTVTASNYLSDNCGKGHWGLNGRSSAFVTTCLETGLA